MRSMLLLLLPTLLQLLLMTVLLFVHLLLLKFLGITLKTKRENLAAAAATP